MASFDQLWPSRCRPNLRVSSFVFSRIDHSGADFDSSICWRTCCVQGDRLEPKPPLERSGHLCFLGFPLARALGRPRLGPSSKARYERSLLLARRRVINASTTKARSALKGATPSSHSRVSVVMSGKFSWDAENSICRRKRTGGTGGMWQRARSRTMSCTQGTSRGDSVCSCGLLWPVRALFDEQRCEVAVLNGCVCEQIGPRVLQAAR